MSSDDERSQAIPQVMALMARQHGAAADLQARACGLSVGRQERLIRSGVLGRFAPGVIADIATEITWHRRAMAATLAPGATATLSGASAARLHRLDGFADIHRVIVTVPHGSRLDVADGVTVVQSRPLSDLDVIVVEGIRVMTIAATLVSLARTRHPRRSQALDAALRDGVPPSDLRATFERWRGPGVSGPVEMLGMLNERVGSRLPLSFFQRIATEVLASRGISLVDEWPVHDARNRLIATLDLADVSLQVGVECQSWEWHGSPAAQRADNLRKRKLRRLGWDIVELWWSDIERPAEVVLDVLDALERAARLRP